MARRIVLALLGSAAIALTACASEAPAPIRLARADVFSVPPVPAELLAPVNGKADSPFQLETGFVLAAQAQMQARRAAAVRATEPAPLAVARAEPASQPAGAPAAPVRLAQAVTVAPRRHALAVAPTVAAPKPLVVASAATPIAPIRYADLTQVSLVLPAPSAVASVAPIAPRGVAVARATVKTRSVVVRKLAVAAAPAATSRAASVRVAARSLPAVVARRVASPRREVLSRIRAAIQGWLTLIRT